MKKKLDLGCGWAKEPDAIGVDRAPLETVDLVTNLDIFPLPFKDNIFDEIYLNDVIEHIPNTIKLMEEIYRISQPDAKVFIKVINWNSEYNAMDPTHVRLFHENTFNFFGEYKDRQYYSSARFKVESVIKRYSQKAKKLFRNKLKLLEFFSYYLNNVLEDLNFTLIALKNEDLRRKDTDKLKLIDIIACPNCLDNKYLDKEKSNLGFNLNKSNWLVCKNNCGYQYPIYEDTPFITKELGNQFFRKKYDELPFDHTPIEFKQILRDLT